MVQLVAKNGVVTDKILLEKASQLAAKMQPPIENFKGSQGWLQGFKNRHKIKQVTAHGESGSAPVEMIELARTAVPALLEELDYTPDDTYNFDETGLYFRSAPSKMLAQGK